MLRLSELDLRRSSEVFSQLRDDLMADLNAEGAPTDMVTVAETLDMQYQGAPGRYRGSMAAEKT